MVGRLGRGAQRSSPPPRGLAFRELNLAFFPFQDVPELVIFSEAMELGLVYTAIPGLDIQVLRRKVRAKNMSATSLDGRSDKFQELRLAELSRGMTSPSLRQSLVQFVGTRMSEGNRSDGGKDGRGRARKPFSSHRNHIRAVRSRRQRCVSEGSARP